MVCLSQEQKKERFIKELLAVNLKILVRVVKHIGAVQLRIEQVIVCFILCSVEPLDMIAYSL